MNETLEPLFATAENLARADDYEGALDVASRLIAQYPDEIKPWDLRGYIHARKGDYHNAIDDLSRAIEINPMEPRFFVNRGRYHLKIGQYPKAVEDFTKTLELCDHYRDDYYREEAHFMRAEAHLKLGRVEDARADLQHVRDNFTTWTDMLRSKETMLDECARK